MTTYVILAAGRGTRIGRVGENLHKCLVPLDGKAIISHQLAHRGDSSQVIICVGHRAEQVQEYVSLAHPNLNLKVTYIHVNGWDRPGGGPGASLLAARDTIGDDDFTFTSCDTLWAWEQRVYTDPTFTWLGVAPIPPGTPTARWCRVLVDEVDCVVDVLDKTPGHEESLAFIGLAHVAREDASLFWEGIERTNEIVGERQVSGGFTNLLEHDVPVGALHLHWTDVGDEESYRQAVARVSGYDWTKTDQATYVLPEESSVVKFHADRSVLERRWHRGRRLHKLGAAAPSMLGRDFMRIEHVPGTSVYAFIEREPRSLPPKGWTITRLLNWLRECLSTEVHVPPDEVRRRALDFYAVKTRERIELLPPGLRSIALDAATRVDWEDLVAGVRPVAWHGDLNFGNVILDESLGFVAIDWREDFSGSLEWGDQRYDVAKLLAGCVVHWDNARRGDFRPWEDGKRNAQVIREATDLYTPDCEVIGALSLLNSAPLHAPPLDEILVARGCAWLAESLA